MEAPLLQCSIVGVLDEKIGQAHVLTNRLCLLSAHQALSLLKNCMSLPKLLHVLRCSECWKKPQRLQTFDNLIREKLQAIANVAMTKTVWEKVSLPLKRGGMGMTLAEDMARPAYLSSLYACSGLIIILLPGANLQAKLNTLVDSWSTFTGKGPPALGDRHRQHNWSKCALPAPRISSGGS